MKLAVPLARMCALNQADFVRHAALRNGRAMDDGKQFMSQAEKKLARSIMINEADDTESMKNDDDGNASEENENGKIMAEVEVDKDDKTTFENLIQNMKREDEELVNMEKANIDGASLMQAGKEDGDEEKNISA